MNTLFELTGYKQDTENKSLQQYLQYLIDTHKVKIANGSFSVAIVPPNANFIYKIWAIDSAWEYWLDICMKNQDKPFIPKIYGKVKKFPNFFLRDERIDGHISVVKMEKLDPLIEPFISIFNDDNSSAIQYMILNNDNVSAGLDKFIEENNKLFYHTEFKKQFVDMIEWLVGKNGSFNFDIHDGNFMMRDNQIVAIDPIYDSNQFNDNNTFTIPRQMDTDAFLPNSRSTQVDPGNDKAVGFGKNRRVIKTPVSPKVIKFWKDPKIVEENNWTVTLFSEQEFTINQLRSFISEIHFDTLNDNQVDIYVEIFEYLRTSKNINWWYYWNMPMSNKYAIDKLLHIADEYNIKAVYTVFLENIHTSHYNIKSIKELSVVDKYIIDEVVKLMNKHQVVMREIAFFPNILKDYINSKLVNK